MSTAVSIGDRVKSWRQIRGLKQVELARLAGLSKYTVNRLEKSRGARVAVIEKIVAALGVTMAEFYGGEERPAP